MRENIFPSLLVETAATNCRCKQRYREEHTGRMEWDVGAVDRDDALVKCGQDDEHVERSGIGGYVVHVC